MIYGQAELHNVEELVHIEGRPGLLMQRVPETVRSGLLEKGREQIRRAAAIEVRFASAGGASVTLASYGGSSKAQVFYGDYWMEDYMIGETPLNISTGELEPMFQFRSPWREQVPRQSFGAIWRIVIQGYEVHLVDLAQEQLRPPLRHEVPALRYLAYGTSITFGLSASSPELSYVSQTAWRLGMDAVNLGMPGTAYCEQAIADHIAARSDWDIASLCLSVNMLNQGISAGEFSGKVKAMIHTITAARPGKPLVCIGLFPSFADLGWSWPGREMQSTSLEYRQVLKEAAESSGFPHVYYVDGRDLLEDWRGLSHDLLHPANSGMIQIGERLAGFMRPLLTFRL
ncbi:GDSL-type esterase/lipase family protein [Paenibacillus ihuae]|uniref:GDSL-type esterase/lipase family protein n=1 Tax=Paenibacillus ihuae TaxID=1232431 RepID=UPI0006D54C0C|nr:GDSL-type esterase/lipase family protein [Paenibacillus ihuae]